MWGKAGVSLWVASKSRRYPFNHTDRYTDEHPSSVDDASKLVLSSFGVVAALQKTSMTGVRQKA